MKRSGLLPHYPSEGQQAARRAVRPERRLPMLVAGVIMGLFVVGLFFSMLGSSPRAGR
jgi:hypothetical protein